MSIRTEHEYVTDHPAPWEGAAHHYVIDPRIDLLTTAEGNALGEHGAVVTSHGGTRLAGCNLTMAEQWLDAATVRLYVNSEGHAHDMLRALGAAAVLADEREGIGWALTVRVGRPLTHDECERLGLDGSGRWGMHYVNGRECWTD